MRVVRAIHLYLSTNILDPVPVDCTWENREMFELFPLRCKTLFFPGTNKRGRSDAALF